MKEGVADGPVQGFGPFLELLPVRGIAGDVSLLHAVGTHLPPLIMVAPQPDLGDGFKLPVLVDFLGINVAMVVQNGHLGGGLVVELLGSGRVQKEVAVKEGFHNRTSNPMFDLKPLYWKPEDLSTQIEEAAPGRLGPQASLPFAASPIGNFLTARQISCIINSYQPWSFIPVL